MRGPLILSYSCRKRFRRRESVATESGDTSSSACGPSLLAASLIRSRQRSTASYVLGSPTKALTSIPAVNPSIRIMFSRMSVNRRIGSLEGTDGLCLYASLHTRLQRPFLYQVDWLSKQAGEPQLDAYQIEQRQPPRFIKAGQQVDIGIRATVAARRGPEHKQTRHAGRPKFRLVTAERGNDMIAVHGYCSSRRLRRASRTSSTRPGSARRVAGLDALESASAGKIARPTCVIQHSTKGPRDLIA